MSLESKKIDHIELAYRGQNWVVIIAAALFFFFEFIQMSMFNSIDQQLMKAFDLDATQLGNVASMYFYGNICFLLVAGILLDRFSTRRLILTAMAVCVLCTYGFAFSQAVWQLEVFRFITGMGAAFCMLSAVRLASRWFPPQRIALVVGVVITIAMLGGIYAQTPVILLTKAINWRGAIIFNASLGVVFWLLILFLVKDYPQNLHQQQLQQKATLNEWGFFPALKRALKNKQNWLAGIYTNIMSWPVVVLGATWGVPYVVAVRHLTTTQASYVTSMIFLGAIVGSPIAGWFSDYIRRRRLSMQLGGVITLIIFVAIMKLPGLGLGSLMVLFFLLGLIASVQVVSYPLVVESNPLEITTTAEGVTCTLIMSAGAIGSLVGWLLDRNWIGLHHADGSRLYLPHNYQIAALVFVVGFSVATLITFAIKETYARHYSQLNEGDNE